MIINGVSQEVLVVVKYCCRSRKEASQKTDKTRVRFVDCKDIICRIMTMILEQGLMYSLWFKLFVDEISWKEVLVVAF